MYDKASFERIFRAFYPDLFAFAHRMVTDSQACEDIVSDAFMAVWQRRDVIEAVTVKSYLFQTVRNSCLNSMRRDAQQRRYAELYARLTSDVDDRDAFAERDERMKRLRHVTDRMDDRTRQIFMQCYQSGKKYREVAAEMGVSESMVKKCMASAIKMFKTEQLKKA